MSDSRFKITIPHCPLCQCPYDIYYHTPLVIPKCGHTFCQKCIQSKVQVRSNRRVFTCPQCSIETIIRRGVNDELPRNISIMDVVKNMKKNIFEEENPSPEKQCPEHQKQLQIFCVSCKNMRICSHCAMFGEHKGHEITDKLPITKNELEDLNQYFQIIKEAIKSLILPDSPDNVLTKAKVSFSEGLQKIVKLTFQQYYEQIEKKEEQLLRECEQIQIHGGISKSIDSLLEEYDFFKLKYDACGIGSDTKIIDQLFQTGKNIHNEIQAISQLSEKTASEALNEAGKQISQTMFFRINEISSTTIKNILKKEKQVTKQKKKMYETGGFQNSRVSQKKSRNSDEIHLLETQKQKKKVNIHQLKSRKTNEEYYKIAKGPSSSKPTAIQNSKTSRPKQSSLLLKKQERNKSKTPRAIQEKTSPEDQCKFESAELKYVKPTKEINYQLRPKFQNLLNEIDKQEVGGCLELINLNINEQIMMHLCEYLRKKKLKYSMMKLVKNGITDEGMRILLSYLLTDNFTKVLNLTGNHVTQKSLDMLSTFVEHNQILKSIYLSNNKINSFQLKSRKKTFDKFYVEVNI